MRFPSVKTHDLNGGVLTVPDELPDGPRIIIVAFQRWHTAQIATWDATLRRLSRAYPQVSVWEVPSLSRAYLLGRFYIDGGMRAGVADADAREHTLTAYVDLRSYMAALGIDDPASIHTMLVDSCGDVIWRAEGEASESKAASLEAALATYVERECA